MDVDMCDDRPDEWPDEDPAGYPDETDFEARRLRRQAALEFSPRQTLRTSATDAGFPDPLTDRDL
jgi:hypothetical protein